MHKPSWLNKKINLKTCRKVKGILRDFNLHTVCEESFCPNISECFKDNLATFMILGDICTRNCSFCGVTKGRPASIDYDEPRRVKEAVKTLNLSYVVITSPTRDDLDDGGAEIFSQTVGQIKGISPSIKVEILIPDFLGQKKAIIKVVNCGADVVAHNLETVPSLYIKVRKEANYERSLDVLAIIKEINKNIYTKSSLILGLGEKESEIISVFKDLRMVGCDFLTLGQYLAPSLRHYPVKEYVSPDKFSYLEKIALDLGFKGLMSSPYTRSSYLAHTLFPDKAPRISQ